MNKLNLRKPDWTTAYLEVHLIDFLHNRIIGVVRKVDDDVIVDAEYSASFDDEWEPVFTLEDIVSGIK